MVKINNQKFFDCKANKELPMKMILKLYEKEAKTCKSMKVKYIKVTCKYKGIRVNLFFVKLVRSQNWHLLQDYQLDIELYRSILPDSVQNNLSPLEQQINLWQLPIKVTIIDPKSINVIDELLVALMTIYCNKEYNDIKQFYNW